MNKNNIQPRSSSDIDIRLALKRVARRLFAEHGVRDVSVRQIAEAARQKNRGVVAYYFGTKDKLVREILIDGAQRIEERRQDYLDRMEANGGPSDLVGAIAAIVLPCAEFSEQDDEYGEYFNRFLLQVSFGNTALIDQTLEGRWNKGYQRCLRHLRRLMQVKGPADQNRRFVFLGAYISALLAQREAMLADPGHMHPTWRSTATLKDIIQTAAALLDAPVD